MIRLFQDIYTDRNPRRQQELTLCLTKNRDMFGDGFFISGGPRPTFREWFGMINRTVESQDDISIIANSDIYFPTPYSFALLKENEVYALSRWDYKAGQTKLYDHEDSQDVWVFRGKIREVEDCDFGLGIPGCDNAIAERLQRAGYTVLNPSKSIVTFHLHNSGVRNYNHRTDKAIDKPYLLVKPHFLNDSPIYREIK